MCREDLGLGRGRIARPGVRVTATANSVLTADPRRVALLISMRGIYGGDPSSGTFLQDEAFVWFADNTNGDPDFTINPTTGPIVLRIEDVGNLIMEPVSVVVDNASTGAQVILKPITSSVQQQPITD